MVGGRTSCIIVVPTYNEIKHISRLVAELLPQAEALDAMIIVADGGSSDGTVDVVRNYALTQPRIRLLHNEKRIQSAALNLAVAQFGDGAEYLIRIDAHGEYPPDYCTVLVREAEQRNVESVVVPMVTKGYGLFQRAVAIAQNSVVGTGGSEHRTGRAGRFVSHGHHALMRIAAYRSVGCYDEAFRHNEDAELDYRLIQAGFRIWLTAETSMTYFPRSSVTSLFKQYFGYGKGRARNLLKHRARLRLRQLLPLLIMPAALLVPLAVVHWGAVIPLGIWAAACAVLGTLSAIRTSQAYGLERQAAPLVCLSAMVMQLAWSAGFWLHMTQSALPRKSLAAVP